MNEIATIPDDVVIHPMTGEAKSLATLTADEVREGIEQLEELRIAVADAKAKLTREAWDRKNAGSPVAGLDVSRSRTWNIRDAAPAVDRLIADGKITTARETLIIPQESYKANGRSLNALVERFIEEGDNDAAQILLTARSERVNAKVASA